MPRGVVQAGIEGLLLHQRREYGDNGPRQLRLACRGCGVSERERETVVVEAQKQFELWREYLEGARLVLVQIKEPRYKRVRLVQPLPGVQLCVLCGREERNGHDVRSQECSLIIKK
jgi:hypothetical protein